MPAAAVNDGDGGGATHAGPSPSVKRIHDLLRTLLTVVASAVREGAHIGENSDFKVCVEAAEELERCLTDEGASSALWAELGTDQLAWDEGDGETILGGLGIRYPETIPTAIEDQCHQGPPFDPNVPPGTELLQQRDLFAALTGALADLELEGWEPPHPPPPPHHLPGLRRALRRLRLRATATPRRGQMRPVLVLPLPWASPQRLLSRAR